MAARRTANSGSVRAACRAHEAHEAHEGDAQGGQTRPLHVGHPTQTKRGSGRSSRARWIVSVRQWRRVKARQNERNGGRGTCGRDICVACSCVLAHCTQRMGALVRQRGRCWNGSVACLHGWFIAISRDSEQQSMIMRELSEQRQRVMGREAEGHIHNRIDTA